jgi:hypothetical protein
VVVGLAGCDVVWGFSRDHGPDEIDAAGPTCDPSSALNPEGCPCNTVNAVQACFLGDNGPESACRFGGQITCGADHLWGACAGAAAPTQEVCFDATDNDCDGKVDNGCTCTNGDNLCLAADGEPFKMNDVVIAVPRPVLVGGQFVVRAVSNQSLPHAAFQSETTYCTGQASTTCTVAGKCAGWNAIEFPPLTAKIAAGADKMFNGTGSRSVTIRINDQGPCTTATRMFSGTVLVQ